MMPSEFAPDCPPGEIEVFRRLRDDEGTRGWIVLHSLDIAEHVTKISGEADFAVIIPHRGVLCLEIKSHTQIARKDGIWLYGQRETRDTRGPFRQAADAMHSLRRDMSRGNSGHGGVVWWSAVIFPFAEADIVSNEWHSWQLVDRRLFSRQPISRICLRILELARANLGERGLSWFDQRSQSPTTDEVKDIAAALRPSFQLVESTTQMLERYRRDLLRYTEEQQLALDRVASNPRVLFTGPAGSGKTLLALEAVRRSAAAGRRQLFLCYNAMLADWLMEMTEEIKGVCTTTLHRFMEGLSGENGDHDHSPEYWQHTLPDMALEGLVNGRGNEMEPFDQLVIDEAQDIMHKPYLDLLDLVIKGGLSAGRWLMFGDFTGQMIFGDTQALGDFKRGREGSYTEYCLSENCRNTPRVAGYTALAGKPGLYTRILRADDGVDPEWHYYETDDEQLAILEVQIQGLLRSGFAPSEITVLSPSVEGAASRLSARKGLSFALGKRYSAKADEVSFCTIHAFKGLEAEVVVLTDIRSLSRDELVDLFYVGVTRALHKLVILVKATVRDEIYKMMSRQESLS
jgi:hypothetical protein